MYHPPVLRILLSAVLLVLIAVPARAGKTAYEALGKFEKEAVDDALATLGRRLDPAPNGKVVRRIVVHNHPVFTRRDGFLQWFNLFHVTTKPEIIAREVVLRPGSRWSQDAVDESVRNVRDPILSNVVAIVGLTTGEPGTVDLLVVTRDVWSLRLNSNIQFQKDRVTVLSFSIAENNLAGWRKHLSVGFAMDEGVYSFGPNYTDPNLAGTHLRLSADFNVLFDRDRNAYEGTSSAFSLAYPLWRLSEPWAGGVSLAHYDGVVRFFQGGTLRTYDAPDTAAPEAIPLRYRWLAVDVTASTTRSFGRRLKQNLSWGHAMSLRHPETLAADFGGDAVVRRAFERDILPRSEVSSGLFVGYELFTATYRDYRDFATYDLREDYRLGPELSLGVTGNFRFMGSDNDYARLSAGVAWTFDPGHRSYLRVEASWSARADADGLTDHTVSTQLYAATPQLGPAVRLVWRAGLDFHLEERSNRFFALGGDTGLRGFAVGQFAGLVRLRSNFEIRSIPWRIWAFRLGGVAFWDMGHAAGACRSGRCDTTAAAFEALEMFHDAGVGIRILIPQINPMVFRVDWAFAINGPAAGWPGRVSFGFFQAF